MIKIKFNNKNNFEEVEFSRDEHTATLKGITEENTSGFCTYRLSGEKLGDFSGFNTIYRVLRDGIQFSDDGSVYVEPTMPEPSDPQPTQLDRIEAQALYTAMMTDTLIEEV